MNEEKMQSFIRGDLMELERLLDICNVPNKKKNDIKKILIRAVCRSSDYGYGLGLMDKMKSGERTEYFKLLNKYDNLEEKIERVTQSNRKITKRMSYYMRKSEKYKQKCDELKGELKKCKK